MARRKRRRIRLGHLLILIAVIYIGSLFWNQHKLERRLTSKRDLIVMEIKALQEDIDEMNKEIEISDTLQFVEKIAREELGMVKPREIIYIDENKVRNSIFQLKKKEN